VFYPKDLPHPIVGSGGHRHRITALFVSSLVAHHRQHIS
jgi:hypothetical protein